MGRENSLINDVLKKIILALLEPFFILLLLLFYLFLEKKNYFYGEFLLTVLHLVRQKYGPVCQKDIADIGMDNKDNANKRTSG